jgi:signal transduction histidine kinase
LQKRAIDVAQLLRQAETRFAVQAARKGLSLCCEGVPESLPQVADPIRLAQVLDNLVSNAIKFTHTGGAVTIALEAEDGGCRITVTDTGQGMDATDLAKLFKEWSRTSAVPTAGERSSGLGLAIVKKIVDAHGGRIDVTSDPGHGTTFAVHLAA